MSLELELQLSQVLIPSLFVVLWSTGYIGARLGLPYAGPLTFLSVRYVIAAVLMVVIALLMQAPWPKRRVDVFHYAIVGLLVHAVSLGGVFVAISLGIEAGLSALIVSLQPLLVAAFAGLMLGERVTGLQWTGLVLGFTGAALILFQKIGGGVNDLLGIVATVVALL